MYRFANPNPRGVFVGDCAVRAVAIATGLTWDEAYKYLVSFGYEMKNLPNADSVWGAFLKSMGFIRKAIPDRCPDCYTVEEFCQDHPRGIYVAATGSHVVAVRNGDYYDSWDSGDEIPIFYWQEVEL